MDFENGSRCIFTLSGLSNAPHHATVSGSLGIIEYKTPFVLPSGITLMPNGLNEKGESWTDNAEPQGHQGLCYQATAFAHYVSKGLSESPVHPHEQSVLALEIIYEILRQLGVSYLPKNKTENLSYEHTSKLLLWC
jgi:hypothetical protein